jgi:hypothetical protein
MEAKSDTVQLGCGTLILIALIVLIFSGGPKVGDLEREVKDLTEEVIVLQEKVDDLTRMLEGAQGEKVEGKTPPQPLQYVE